ncbi:hypothetical protein F2Q70_00001984, partial [Brassica cretica]
MNKNDSTVHLSKIFNPSKKKTISLPPLTRDKFEHLVNVSVSSPNDEEECVVAVKFYGSRVSLCRLGDSEWTRVDVPCPSFHFSTIVYSERDKRFYVNNCNPDYTGPTDFTPTSNPGLLTPVSGYKRFPFSNFLEASSNPRFRFAFTMPRLARELDPIFQSNSLHSKVTVKQQVKISYSLCDEHHNFIDIEKESLFRLSITTMANSFTFLADLKAGRCSNNEEAIQHVSWTIAEFSFSVMEFQQRKCCVILELSSNLPRVLEVCTSAIPQAFLDGTDTNPSRLTEEGTNVPKVALPEVVVPGRDDKDGLCFQCRTAVASPTKDHRPEQQLNLHKQCSYPSQLELSAISLATWEGSELAKAFFDHRDNAELLGPCFVLFLSGGITIQVHYILVQVLYSLSFCWVFEPLKLFIIISSLPPRFRESSRDSVSLKVKAFTLLVTLLLEGYSPRFLHLLIESIICFVPFVVICMILMEFQFDCFVSTDGSVSLKLETSPYWSVPISSSSLGSCSVGSYFVGQYYQVLQQQPDLIHQFYSETSKAIRVDGDSSETADTLLNIHNMVMSLNFTAIEVKTINSVESWEGGVLVAVSGSVKTKEFSNRRSFMQTFFLAPQEKGYFVLNDIFQFINEGTVSYHQPSYLSESNRDEAQLNPPNPHPEEPQ